MAFLYDHLASTIIGAAVLLILFTLQQQVRESTVDRTAMYAAKRATLDFGMWVQKDLSNIGTGVPKGQVIFQQADTNAAGVTTLFSYRRQLSDSLSTTIVTVTYEAAQTGTTTIDGVSVPTYQIVRKEDGVANGRSPQRLTSFRIQLLGADGSPVSGWDFTEYIRLRFSMALPYNERKTKLFINETHWETTLPVNH